MFGSKGYTMKHVCLCALHVQLPVCGKERASPCVCYLFVRYYSKLKYCPLSEHCPPLLYEDSYIDTEI